VSQDFHAVAILLIGEVIGRITNESIADAFRRDPLAERHWSETVLAFAQHWSLSFSGLASVWTAAINTWASESSGL
jgi:hypothetical protein